MIDYSSNFSTDCPFRAAQQFVLHGFQVRSGVVRSFWNLHNVLTREQQLLRPDKNAREPKRVLPEDQIRFLKRFILKFISENIESDHTDYLVASNTFFTVPLKGGNLSMIFLRLPFSKRLGPLNTGKLLFTSFHDLNEEILSFFKNPQSIVIIFKFDNGSQFFCLPELHTCNQVFLFKGDKYRITKLRQSQSNGIFIIVHRTLFFEYYSKSGRKKWCEYVDEIQKVLDVDLTHFNQGCCH